MNVFTEKGFSLIELLVAIAIFAIAMAAAAGSFTPLVNQFKQQSKSAETQIEGIMGLELLRLDIEHAGFGLPWEVSGATDANGNGSVWDELQGYAEASDTTYNDAPLNPPRALVIGNNIGASGNGMGINGSDYLVIKGTNVRINNESQKWTYIHKDSATGAVSVNSWGKPDLDIQNQTRVIVMSISGGDNPKKALVTYPAGLNTFVYNDTFSNIAANLSPLSSGATYIVYGIGPDAALRMPFNRADYYITDPNVTGSTVPSRCAPNTGVLVKAEISHTNGNREGGLPLIDCVADFQVVLGLDMDDDGTIGTYTDYDTAVDGPSDPEGASILNVQNTLDSADLLRKRLKEVRIYILVHEGQYDRYYNYSGQNPISVGDPTIGISHNVDLSALGNNWQNYRWKVYTMAVKPMNLGE